MDINEIKLVTQKRNNTCGYATAGILINYFEGMNIDEDYLLANELFDEKGITFFKLLEVYKKYLKEYDASLIHEDKENTLVIIKQSLQENIPFQILYLTENVLGNNEPVLHYAVLTGYDETKEVFTIADPYGAYKTIGKNKFFDAVSFKNDCLPEFIKKAMPSNVMIKFSKRTDV